MLHRFSAFLTGCGAGACARIFRGGRLHPARRDGHRGQAHDGLGAVLFKPRQSAVELPWPGRAVAVHGRGRGAPGRLRIPFGQRQGASFPARAGQGGEARLSRVHFARISRRHRPRLFPHADQLRRSGAFVPLFPSRRSLPSRRAGGGKGVVRFWTGSPPCLRTKRGSCSTKRSGIRSPTAISPTSWGFIPIKSSLTAGREPRRSTRASRGWNNSAPACGVGFSFCWAAALYALAKNGEGARYMLKIFRDCFVSPNGFHLNGDFRRNGGVSSSITAPSRWKRICSFPPRWGEMLLQSEPAGCACSPPFPKAGRKRSPFPTCARTADFSSPPPWRRAECKNSPFTAPALQDRSGDAGGDAARDTFGGGKPVDLTLRQRAKFLQNKGTGERRTLFPVPFLRGADGREGRSEAGRKADGETERQRRSVGKIASKTKFPRFAASSVDFLRALRV